MSATIHHLPSERCNDMALRLMRASVRKSLEAYQAEKNRESRALRALEVAVRIYIAAAWTLALLAFAALTLGLPAFIIGLIVGHFTR